MVNGIQCLEEGRVERVTGESAGGWDLGEEKLVVVQLVVQGLDLVLKGSVQGGLGDGVVIQVHIIYGG